MRLTVTLLSLLMMNFNLHSQPGSTQVLDQPWKFIKGKQENPTGNNFDDSNWETVSVPHDWAIAGPFILDGNGSTGKLPWKDEGWYRTKFSVSQNNSGKRIYLLFDGVMAFPEVYVNGKLAGTWDYGYNSFYLDVTDQIMFGEENQLAVHADTRKHGSRWYPGGGIYRKVSLLIKDPVHVDIWGTFITTPIIKPNYADIRIQTRIINKTETPQILTLKHSIYFDGEQVASVSDSGGVGAGTHADLEVNVQLSNPRKWDVDHPVRYLQVTEVIRNGEVVDVDSVYFGIRSIAFTADDGFHLNGRRVQLKGVNLHHDFGPLGAAFNERALERQLEIMKSMGVNAIRNSHNVAAPELAELCDRMGLLFFNEVFDKYDDKADMLPMINFDEFAHRNISNFVRRDRNHPSVFLWSVGNEIGDVQYNIDGGFRKLHTMVNYVDKYDPTRPVTLVCDQMQSAALRHFDYYDVHSYNYNRRYDLARRLEPNKSVIISESASTLSTRGFYEFPLPDEKTDFTKSLQVSSYDLHAPWWAEVADDDFMWQQDEPYVAGEFVWTGFDYLGEPTPYDNATVLEMGMEDEQASRSSYFGIVDLVGIPKDRYYLYKSYWKPEENTVHILPHWNWPDRVGQNVPVFVYTNGDCAELFLNGKSLGKQCKQPASQESLERFRLMWEEVIYEPGEVRAVAYKGGSKIGEHTIRTSGEASRLSAEADRPQLMANGKDLSYVLIEAVDKQGEAVPTADQLVSIQVEGPARIAGVGNGNPQSFEPFQGNQVKLFYGKAMLILITEKEAGRIEVKFTADKLKPVSITVNSK